MTCVILRGATHIRRRAWRKPAFLPFFGLGGVSDDVTVRAPGMSSPQPFREPLPAKGGFLCPVVVGTPSPSSRRPIVSIIVRFFRKSNGKVSVYAYIWD